MTTIVKLTTTVNAMLVVVAAAATMDELTIVSMSMNTAATTPVEIEEATTIVIKLRTTVGTSASITTVMVVLPVTNVVMATERSKATVRTSKSMTMDTDEAAAAVIASKWTTLNATSNVIVVSSLPMALTVIGVPRNDQGGMIRAESSAPGGAAVLHQTTYPISNWINPVIMMTMLVLLVTLARTTVNVGVGVMLAGTVMKHVI